MTAPVQNAASTASAEPSTASEDETRRAVLAVAVAFLTSRSSVKLKGRSTKYEPIGRLSMIVRRTSEGWRAIHFHESARSAQSAEVMHAEPRSG